MRTLGVFARWPEPGKVKTRLSPALAPAIACALHRAMLRDTLEAARASEADARVLFWADPPPDGAGAAAAGFRAAVQRGSDLGARLAGAFSEMLAAPGDRAVVIGSDAPEIAPASLALAFEALAAADLVVGPTPDGGYHLIGLARPAPALFEDIPWSTGSVRSRTLERARLLGLQSRVLATIADVDTPADLAALVARAAGGAPLPRHTRQTLAVWGLYPGGAAASAAARPTSSP